MSTKKGRELVGKLLKKKEELEDCNNLEEVFGLRDSVNHWLGNLLKSSRTRYPLSVIEGCCFSWRLAVRHAQEKFNKRIQAVTR